MATFYILIYKIINLSNNSLFFYNIISLFKKKNIKIKTNMKNKNIVLYF